MASESAPQPAPQPGKETVLPVALGRLGSFAKYPGGALLMQSLVERAAAGEKKYGVRLQTFNGRDAVTDAFQEAQDAVMYLTQKWLETGDNVHTLDLLHLAEDLALGIAQYIEREKSGAGS